MQRNKTNPPKSLKRVFCGETTSFFLESIELFERVVSSLLGSDGKYLRQISLNDKKFLGNE